MHSLPGVYVSPVCLSLYVDFFSVSSHLFFPINRLVMNTGPILIQNNLMSSCLITSAKLTLFPNKVTFMGSKWTYIWDHHSPHYIGRREIRWLQMEPTNLKTRLPWIILVAPCNHWVLKSRRRGRRVGQRDWVGEGLDPTFFTLKIKEEVSRARNADNLQRLQKTRVLLI